MSSSWLLLLAVFVVAGIAQRVTGIGFALIATPVAMSVLGTEAISLVVVLGAVSGIAALVATWRRRRLSQVVAITAWTVPLLCGCLLLVPLVDDAVLRICAGALVIGATLLSAVRLGGPLRTLLRSPAGAGAIVAVSAATAGLGGPAAAAHGALRDWGDAFVPNVQVVLLATTPLVVVGHGWSSSLSPGPLVLAVVAVIIGTIAGSLLQRRIAPAVALRGTQTLAIAGGLAAIVGGVLALA